MLLEARGIGRSFSGVKVLDSVDFAVRPGEVHALVGGNGAGKSTFMHILAGVLQPDAGTLLWEGQPVRFAEPRAAQAAGVAMVFQEGSLAPTLSVAENVFFARQPTGRGGIIRPGELRRATRALLDELGLAVDPGTPVELLSAAQRQMVEVAKALSLKARLFLFDEPTSALTDEETRHLFAVIERLRAHGAGIVYISHRMAEVFRIASRITVLRDGRAQGTLAAADCDPDRVISLMVGREFESSAAPEAGAGAGAPVLEVRGLDDGAFLHDINLEVRAGEIVALAGLAGSGRTELALALFGARPYRRGHVLLDSQPLPAGAPQAAIRGGLGYLSEDRKEDGLFLEMGIAENMASARLASFGRFWQRRRAMAAAAGDYCRRLGVAGAASVTQVGQLSGGNQQKVALARWLSIQPRCLIADEPTRGIDIAAKLQVHATLRELARNGAAVLVISSELPEVLALAGRVYVMREGRIAAALRRAEASEASILRHAMLSREGAA